MRTPTPPTLSPDTVAYAWDELCRRAAGASADNGFPPPCVYANAGATVAGGLSEPAIVIQPCAPQAWQELLELPPDTIERVPVSALLPPGAPRGRLPDRVPILFRGSRHRENEPLVRVHGRAVVLNVDVIAATLFMLTRWEETVRSCRDEHARFPASESTAWRQGFLDVPVIDHYALVLRAWVRALFPGWRPQPRPFRIRLTHDIDRVNRAPSTYYALRMAAGDITKRHAPAAAVTVLRDQVLPRHALYLRRIADLATHARRAGLDSTFYVMTARKPDPAGCGYDPRAHHVRACLQRLAADGFDVGLHPSYGSFASTEQLREEKHILESVLGRPVHRVRQHYLRFRTPDTWRCQAEAGFDHDSTMLYPEHEGFRCGTCQAFQAFDIDTYARLGITEHPVTVMDGTLALHRNLTPEQGEQRILELARRVRDAEGDFALLWHNTSLDGDFRAWGERYPDMLRRLASMQGETAPVEMDA